ncbi:MAG: yfkN 1 [Firmicutes bacterium]|nr:yfkN 1 [Bacillota bacterium]
MKSKRKYLIKVLEYAVMVLVLVANIPAASAATSATVAVLETSDLHSNILDWNYLTNAQPANTAGTALGLARISSLVNQERNKYRYNILVDNGDVIQGTPLASYYATVDKDSWKVHPMIAVMNYIKYDAINLGNHEFNFGLDFLRKVVAGAHCSVLSANTRSTLNNTTWKYVQPYTIKKITLSDGDVIKIGVIGTITPAIPSFESSANYQGLEFTSQENTINQYIKDLQDKGVDTIIVLTHSGIPSSSSTYPENGVVAIANSVPAGSVSLICAGHTHTVVDNTVTGGSAISDDRGNLYVGGVVNGIPVIEPKNAGTYLMEAVMNFTKNSSGKWTVGSVSTNHYAASGVSDDASVTSMASNWDTTVKKWLQTPIGTSTAKYTGINGNKMYTPLVDLVNKAELYYGNADIASGASFSATAEIPQGMVKLQDIASAYIYENYMYTIQINGAQLKQYLELCAAYFDQVAPGTGVDVLSNPADAANVTMTMSGWPSYNYDMLTGARNSLYYEINISKPVGSRIQKLTYNGKAIDDADTFKLAMNNYRFNGGGPNTTVAGYTFALARGLSGYMAVMGLDVLGRNGLSKPTVLWSSQTSIGDAGQVRNLMLSYVQKQETITPNTTPSWKLVSN